MFTETHIEEKYLSLKEQYLKELERNMMLKIFEENEAQLREKVKKKLEKET